DEDEVEDACAEVEIGPALLDVPLDGSTKTSLVAMVPAGSYRAIEIRIRPATSGDKKTADFLTAHPEFKDISVRIEGTSNGKALVFTAPVDKKIEAQLSPPVTVDAGHPNVTVAIDISNWFSDGNGGVLDPSNAANAARITANIGGSVHCFEDDDHD